MNGTRGMESVFIDHLEYEIDLYSQLYNDIGQKQKALIAGDVDELRDLVYEEKELVGKARDSLAQRGEIIRTLLETYHLDPQVGIEVLLQHFPIELRDKGRRLVAELVLLGKKIQNLNQENGLLINTTLNFIQDVFTLLYNQTGSPLKVYQQNGIKEVPTEKKGLVDYQV